MSLKDIADALRGLYVPNLVLVPAEKIVVCSGAYEAEDVVSESTTAGTAWRFSGCARKPGGGGYIMGALVVAQTTNIAGWFSMFMHTKTPTCALNDDAANTAPIAANKEIYLGRINFDACSDLGSGAPDAIATPSTSGGLPIPFVCQPNSTDLYGVMVIRNAVDLADNTWLRVTLAIERY